MATLKISDTSKVSITSFKTKDGDKHLNVRKFYKTKNSEEWLPTKQGFTIAEEHAETFLRKFKKAFANIDEEAVELEPRKGKGKRMKVTDEEDNPRTKKKKRRDNDEGDK